MDCKGFFEVYLIWGNIKEERNLRVKVTRNKKIWKLFPWWKRFEDTGVEKIICRGGRGWEKKLI